MNFDPDPKSTKRPTAAAARRNTALVPVAHPGDSPRLMGGPDDDGTKMYDMETTRRSQEEEEEEEEEPVAFFVECFCAIPRY